MDKLSLIRARPPKATRAQVRKRIPNSSCSSTTRQHYFFLLQETVWRKKKCLFFKKTKELKRKTNKNTSPTELCSTLHLQSGALGSSSAASRNVRISVLEKSPRRHSVVSGPSFLHASSFGFGDVLVVGLVLQLSAEVLDGFVQALLQRHLLTHNITTSGA